MSERIVITRHFRPRKTCRHSRKEDKSNQRKQVPRISRLMALAIYFQQMIEEGVVSDQTEIARLGHVSRARVTQIMNLLNLAPDIQEKILELSVAESGCNTITERNLRLVTVHHHSWKAQRKALEHIYTLSSGASCLNTQ